MKRQAFIRLLRYLGGYVVAILIAAGISFVVTGIGDRLSLPVQQACLGAFYIAILAGMVWLVVSHLREKYLRYLEDVRREKRWAERDGDS